MSDYLDLETSKNGPRDRLPVECTLYQTQGASEIQAYTCEHKQKKASQL